jgi:hypothetical protein
MWRNILKPSLAAIVAGLFVLGCVSMQAETPAQRYYAAKADYYLLLSTATAYAETPSASPSIVDRIVELDTYAQAVMEQADELMRVTPDGPNRDAALRELSSMLVLVTIELRRAVRGIPIGEIPA